MILDGVEFTPVSGTISFEEGEICKQIVIPVLDIYRISKIYVALYDPSNGCKLSRKATTRISIVGDDAETIKAKGIEEIIKFMQKDQHISWLQQFKHACILSPKIDENGMIDDVNELEAAIHYASIGWKVLFATIPPSRFLKGWPCLIASFIYIGLITALVLEFAALLGCVMKFKQALIGISLVAIGTSLPDVFSSRHAAIKSEDADIAIGGITGSICINAFLGFGLPWLIGSIYYTSKGQDFVIPTEELSFTILIYMLTSFLCLITLFIRRFAFGGEIGGKNQIWRYITVGWFVFLWGFYLLFSVLRSYGAL